MGQRMQQIVQQWPGNLIPAYVPKWHGKPLPNREWLARMKILIGIATGVGMLFGFIIRSPLLLFSGLGIGGIVLGIVQGIWGERQRTEQREHAQAAEFVQGWMKQFGLHPQYDEKRCLHVLACLAHLVHHSNRVEEAATHKGQLRLAEQFMSFLYGTAFERDFGDKLDVGQLRPLVSVAELQQPDSLISEHYRTYRGYREGGRRGTLCIMDIQFAVA